MTLTEIDAALAVCEATVPAPWVVSDDATQVIAPCPCCGPVATCFEYGAATGDKEHDAKYHYASGLIALARIGYPAALRALREFAWRPIEEAPKDGTKVIGWCAGDGIELISWRSVVDYEIPKAERWRDEDGWSSAATHFMPLPAPPVAEGTSIKECE